MISRGQIDGWDLLVRRAPLIWLAPPIWLPPPIWLILLPLLFFATHNHSAHAATIIVAESGGDFTSVQAGLDAASAGDTVLVRQKATPYFEKIDFPSSGSPPNAYVTLMAYPGEHPILDGTGVPNNPTSYTDDIVYIAVSYTHLTLPTILRV